MVYMTPLGNGVARPKANWGEGWGTPNASFWCVMMDACAAGHTSDLPENLSTPFFLEFQQFFSLGFQRS